MHGLKGSSYGVCAYDLGKRAEGLEFAAKRGDRQTVQANHRILLEQAENLLADVRKLLESAAADVEKKLVPAPDAVSLEKMLQAVKRFDMRALEHVVSELERYEYESDGDLVPWLRDQIDNLEYDAIRERLEFYIASQNSN